MEPSPVQCGTGCLVSTSYSGSENTGCSAAALPTAAALRRVTRRTSADAYRNALTLALAARTSEQSVGLGESRKLSVGGGRARCQNENENTKSENENESHFDFL